MTEDGRVIVDSPEGIRALMFMRQLLTSGATPAVQTRHWLVVDGSDRRVALQVGTNVVGRGQDADLRLADTGVSRRHIEIRFDGQTAMLQDLGSTNGTIVNGHRVQSWQLADGDVIRIGHSVLVYRQAPG